MTPIRQLVGVHRDMPAEQYHALPGASASRLRKLWQTTPAHLRVSMREKVEPTPAMILGTLAHHAVLEPDRPFPKLVYPPDTYPAPADSSLVKTKKVAAGDPVDWNWNAKYCKAWKRNIEASGATAVSRTIYDSTFGAALSIARHPDAGPLVTDGDSEVTLVAWDETNDIAIRCRLDFVTRGEFLVDCKFTHDVTPRAFQRHAYDMGYHIQAALYLDAWNALCGAEERKTGFKFIACEQDEPWGVVVFNCSEEFVSFGRVAYSVALATFAKCMREDSWPAYPDGEVELDVPRWATGEI